MNFSTQLITTRASFSLFLFALTFSLTLSSCKKDPTPITTTINGKVVTFREDSLYYDGPIDVTLRFAWGTFPQDRIETKTIYPPYEYNFKLDTAHRVYDELTIDIETRVPGHATYYAGDGQNAILGTTQELTTSLMPKTAIQYELINEDQQPGDFISLRRLGGGAHTVSNAVSYILDEGWYNGEYPIKYTVGSDTGTIRFLDTLHLNPFDTLYHTIRY